MPHNATQDAPLTVSQWVEMRAMQWQDRSLVTKQLIRELEEKQRLDVLLSAFRL